MESKNQSTNVPCMKSVGVAVEKSRHHVEHLSSHDQNWIGNFLLYMVFTWDFKHTRLGLIEKITTVVRHQVQAKKLLKGHAAKWGVASFHSLFLTLCKRFWKSFHRLFPCMTSLFHPVDMQWEQEEEEESWPYTALSVLSWYCFHQMGFWHGTHIGQCGIPWHLRSSTSEIQCCSALPSADLYTSTAMLVKAPQMHCRTKTLQSSSDSTLEDARQQTEQLETRNTKRNQHTVKCFRHRVLLSCFWCCISYVS